MNTLKILIADDHTLFRNGLKMLLNGTPGYQVTAEASNGKEFLHLIMQEDFDIVFLDIEMPEMDGLTAAPLALQHKPDLKIITLSMYGEDEYYYKMVDAGVKGFLLKNSDINEVKQAIEAVAAGGNYFSQELMQNLVRNLKFAKETNNPSPEFELSGRELEILLLVCQGFSNQEIGEKLNISRRTVEKHRANILGKTNCKNTASLVMYAIRNQLIVL